MKQAGYSVPYQLHIDAQLALLATELELGRDELVVVAELELRTEPLVPEELWVSQVIQT